ncbi:MAG TPA: VOC family protein [Bryobacteraceae bacterium]|nr:VOC family protein [Bryobacteraceae bacterium]
MSIVDKHAPGCFCWVELGTTDAKAAKSFYGGLFGWQPNDMPMGPDQFYTMLRINGKDVGAMYELDKNMREMGIPPHWMQYVAVSSADESAARVEPLGGKVMKGPFDVFDAGRMAVIQDPTGAVFCLWQANRNTGIQMAGEPGTLCWSELATNDKPKAIDFYIKLFGWSMKTNPADPFQYTEISNQGRPMGGILKIEKEWGDVPPNWMPYFLVANCDAGAEKAKQTGGTVKIGPMDIPNTGRFAVIGDPQGAVFAIFQPAGNR